MMKIRNKKITAILGLIICTILVLSVMKIHTFACEQDKKIALVEKTFGQISPRPFRTLPHIFYYRCLSSTEEKQVSASQQKQAYTVQGLQKRATIAGSHVIVRPRPLLSTFAKWEEKIKSAKENGDFVVLPSGEIRFDFGNMQGLMLPKDKISAANGEPVFFSCSKKLKSGEYGVGGNCNTLYSLKHGLEIGYSQPEWAYYREGELLKRDSLKRKAVEEFIGMHPDFYTEADIRGN